MAYNYPKKPKPPTPPQSQQPQPQPQQSYPSFGDTVRGIGDAIKAPFAGFYNGFFNTGKNYEQWMREKQRKRRGLAPPRNWLQRLT